MAPLAVDNRLWYVHVTSLAAFNLFPRRRLLQQTEFNSATVISGIQVTGGPTPLIPDNEHEASAAAQLLYNTVPLLLALLYQLYT